MYPKIRLKNGQQIGRRGLAPLEIGRQRRPSGTVGSLSLTGQVSLEIALSLICIFLLLWGSLAIFLWANNRFILRQEDYEETRVEAGSSRQEKQIDESNYPKLDIFEGYGGR